MKGSACAAVLLAPLLALGCSTDIGASLDADAGLASSQLLGGDYAATSHPQVAYLRNEGSGFEILECVAIIVAPNLIVTSRACLVPYHPERFVCRLDGSITSDSGQGGLFGSDPVEYSQVLIYKDRGPTGPMAPPDGRGALVLGTGQSPLIHDGGPHLCGHDLAFLVLEEPIPGTELLPLQLERAPLIDEPVDIVGWGATENRGPGNEGYIKVTARNLLRDVPVTVVNPIEPDPAAADLPGAPRTFHSQLLVCDGDAGAGAFTKAGELIGIAASNFQEEGSLGPCGEGFSTYSMLSAFPSVVEEAFSLAGQPIWRAGEPYPGSVDIDGRCERNESCASGVCLLQNQDGGFCVEGCAADSDCSEGTVCRLTDEGGYCSATADGAEGGCRVAQPGRSTTHAWLLLLTALGLGRRLRASSAAAGSRSGRDG